MSTTNSILYGVLRRGGSSFHRRCLHQTSTRHAITKMQMPAMSPTMTEGGIASWKKKEGENFVAGDVLLEIETDKATIDVEAQDDGVLGKIIAPDGAKNVAVGKTIALLAEDGDDISNLEIPKDDPVPPPKQEDRSSPSPPPIQPSAPTPAPADPSTSSKLSSSHSIEHTHPLFPSVHRLLLEHAISNPSNIIGTGIRGMLTKGDVLTFLGKASGPLGSYAGKEPVLETKTAKAKDEGGARPEDVKPLDGPALRRLIVSNLLQLSLKARNAQGPTAPATFDSIIADYLPATPSTPKPQTPPFVSSTPKKSATEVYFDGLI